MKESERVVTQTYIFQTERAGRKKKKEVCCVCGLEKGRSSFLPKIDFDLKLKQITLILFNR